MCYHGNGAGCKGCVTMVMLFAVKGMCYHGDVAGCKRCATMVMVLGVRDVLRW